ncbi:MAG TPA: lysine-sensitive aspartokinase 3 [Pyrinomonadaceae bacterium]|jgi:aspartate kinase|nr:lysine-sensitive aspartokinase 3 [Pyrinomonadaceae bacterium]
MKFGGTSVGDARAFERVAALVERASADTRPVVVVSAMSRFTDALLEAFERAAGGSGADAAAQLEEHFERHTQVADALLKGDSAAEFGASLEEARRGLSDLLCDAADAHANESEQSRRLLALKDEVVSHGEQLSSKLLAAVLRGRGIKARQVDARRCVITDDEHGRANPLKEETDRHTREELEPLIEAGEVPVLGGFIASSAATGATTTLGRGGSDYTAGLVGAALRSEEIQIWTDVPGVLTADPRIVSEARTIRHLSYAEAAELAYFGAKVLHPKTILPAVVRNVPVRICNSRRPKDPDTVVYFDAEMTPRTVKAIAHKSGVSIVHITSARMLGAYGFLRAIFEVFERHRTAVDIVTTSEVSVSLSLEEAGALPEIIADLEKISAVKVETERAIVCIVGEGLRTTSGIAARVFSTIKDINVLLISQGASSVNLTFVVEERHVEEAVRRLHAAFFECATAELLAHIGGGQ